MKILIFGKKGCDLCENRLQSATKFKEVFAPEIEIEYYDAETPDGLTELAMLGIEVEIPAVVMTDEDDNIIQSWIGPTGNISVRTLKCAIEEFKGEKKNG